MYVRNIDINKSDINIEKYFTEKQFMSLVGLNYRQQAYKIRKKYFKESAGELRQISGRWLYARDAVFSYVEKELTAQLNKVKRKAQNNYSHNLIRLDDWAGAREIVNREDWLWSREWLYKNSTKRDILGPIRIIEVDNFCLFNLEDVERFIDGEHTPGYART